MIDSDIYNAFCLLAADFALALSPPLVVAYPNVAFTPPDDAPWIEVRWFPNETQNYGVSNDGPSMRRGFFQIGVATRVREGLAALTDVVGLAIVAFAKGTQFGGARIPRKPWASSVLEEPDRALMYITVPYYAMPDEGVTAPATVLQLPAPRKTINFLIGGGGATIAAGVQGDIVIDEAGDIVGWQVLDSSGDAIPAGDIVIDLWKSDYAGYEPTVADTITGTEKPSLSGTKKNENSSLAGGSGWAVAAGSIVRVYVESATTCQRVTLALRMR